MLTFADIWLSYVPRECVKYGLGVMFWCSSFLSFVILQWMVYFEVTGGNSQMSYRESRTCIVFCTGKARDFMPHRKSMPSTVM